MTLQEIGQLLNRCCSRTDLGKRAIQLITETRIGFQNLIKLRGALLEVCQRDLGLVKSRLQISDRRIKALQRGSQLVKRLAHARESAFNLVSIRQVGNRAGGFIERTT